MPQTPKVNSSQLKQILGLNTIAFIIFFAVWTIFSSSGVQIKQDLGLTDSEFRLLVGTLILTGSLSHIFLGNWTNQFSGRVVFFLTMLLTAIATFILSYATTYPMMLLAALGVGLACGTFAAGSHAERSGALSQAVGLPGGTQAPYCAAPARTHATCFSAN